MDWSNYNVMHIMKGCRFNFFNKDDENNVREIDLIIEIQKNNSSKIIAIECKKTLSRKEIQMTNKKCKEKILESGNNIFDAFIHIGCFKGDVEFDVPFSGTREKTDKAQKIFLTQHPKRGILQTVKDKSLSKSSTPYESSQRVRVWWKRTG